MHVLINICYSPSHIVSNDVELYGVYAPDRNVCVHLFICLFCCVSV